MHYYTICNSDIEKSKIILVLFSHGYTWRSGSNTVVPGKDLDFFKKCLAVFIDKRNLSITQGEYLKDSHLKKYEKIDIKDILNENDSRIFCV